MDIRTLQIPGPVVIVPRKFSDARGFLSETYSDAAFATTVAPVRFVQENHTYSEHAGTVRGIHFQVPPHAQGKLVRVVRGAIFDVVVDLRAASPHFGRHAVVKLSAANWDQLWVPEGFGHGVCTLEPHTEIIYKVTTPYHPASERGIAWDDPDLAIAWPFGPREPVLSDRDRCHPRLAEAPAYF
ncbi:MAG: dTDP-4-dehydrorhamnose 3,5-epimerase [Xanthobacteraceae bacterium]|nr:dTDP-4-dehydrorhamnose 3,5-epimerase [Xanthobacteraceae bacterium]